MTHEQVQDLLEAYVDETLERATRAEVDHHLRDCDECRTILEGVPAVQLQLAAPGQFDERAMRKAVRTTLVRLAADVVMIVVVGFLVVMLLSWLVFQPFLINRGGRAAAATQATEDLAVMYNPGAVLTDRLHSSGIVSRTSEATVAYPVGTEMVELGTLRTKIGLLSFGAAEGGSVFPYLASSGADAPAGEIAEQLMQVGDGTVTTVELHFDPPVSLARARELADSPLDVRVVWAGFATSDNEPRGIGLEPDGVVGYDMCDYRDSDPDLLAAPSGGGSGGVFTQAPSVERALDATRAAIANLLSHPELVDGIRSGVSLESVTAAGDYLAGDPGVRTLVVTGPTPEVRRFITEAAPTYAGVRGIDFSNWYQPLCGR